MSASKIEATIGSAAVSAAFTKESRRLMDCLQGCLCLMVFIGGEALGDAAAKLYLLPAFRLFRQRTFCAAPSALIV
jgi:hypothetical protein